MDVISYHSAKMPRIQGPRQPRQSNGNRFTEEQRLWIRDRWYALEAEGVQVKAERARRIRAEWPGKFPPPQGGPPSAPTIESTVQQIDERFKTGYK